MKHEKETWAWEVKLMLTYIGILAGGFILAGMLGGEGFWRSEFAKMKEQSLSALFLLSWIVVLPIGGIMLRRYYFCWSKQANQFEREKAEHEERMKKYFEA